MFLLYSQIPLIFIKVLNISLFYYFIKIIIKLIILKNIKKILFKAIPYCKLSVQFCRLPLLTLFYIIINQSFLSLDTCCGYWYDLF